VQRTILAAYFYLRLFNNFTIYRPSNLKLFVQSLVLFGDRTMSMYPNVMWIQIEYHVDVPKRDVNTDWVPCRCTQTWCGYRLSTMSMYPNVMWIQIEYHVDVPKRDVATDWVPCRCTQTWCGYRLSTVSMYRNVMWIQIEYHVDVPKRHVGTNSCEVL
jgi:hypothetical protein